MSVSPAGREPLQSLEFLDRAEAARRAQLARDRVLAALIVRRRAEAARRRRLQFNPLEEAVERQIKIQPRLFAIGDDVEAGRDLVMNGRDDRVIFQLLAVGFTELVEVLTGKLEPAGNG